MKGRLRPQYGLDIVSPQNMATPETAHALIKNTL